MFSCASGRWHTRLHAQRHDNTVLLLYFGHISLILTPIRPPFEPMSLSSPSTGILKTNRTYLTFFWLFGMNFDKESKLQRGSFFFASPLIPSLLLVEFSPLSQEQAPYLRIPQPSNSLGMIWEQPMVFIYRFPGLIMRNHLSLGKQWTIKTQN